MLCLLWNDAYEYVFQLRLLIITHELPRISLVWEQKKHK